MPDSPPPSRSSPKPSPAVPAKPSPTPPLSTSPSHSTPSSIPSPPPVPASAPTSPPPSAAPTGFTPGARPPLGFTPGLRPSKPLPSKPRRVRGGVKFNLPDDQVPWAADRGSNWAAQRWVRLLEQAAPGKVLLDGLEYARLGQTRSFHVEPGAVVGLVQGRADRAYATRLRIPAFTVEQWESVVKAMTDQAVYAAKLLSGELPPNIEDVFGPLDLKLFPTLPTEVGCSCACADFRATAQSVRAGGAGPAPADSPLDSSAPVPAALSSPPPEPPLGVHVPWCKHAACITYLFAHRLMTDPFLMFKVRGLDGSELIDRLRHSRAIASTSRTSASIYAARVPGVTDLPPAPLEESLQQFWDIGPNFDQFEAPLEAPPVSHPLLRRLGPSPLAAPAAGAPGATFPLVGLLASCYETAAESALRAIAAEARSDAAAAPDAPAAAPSDDES